MAVPSEYVEIIDRLGPLVEDLNQPGNIVANTQHKLVGAFPAPADYDSATNEIQVIADQDTLTRWREEYCDEIFTEETLNFLYVRAGIASAVLRSQLDPTDVKRIKAIHTSFSSPDNLSQQILESAEAGDISEEDEKTLLLALCESWLVPDVAIVNGARLAVGLAALVRGSYGEDVIRITKNNMQTHLAETLHGRKLYSETRAWLGDVSPEESQQLFMNTMPTIEIVGSFPMPPQEVVRLTTAIIER